MGPSIVPGTCVSFVLQRAARVEPLQILRCGESVVLIIFLPTDHPGIVVRCRIEAEYRDLSRFRWHLVRDMNHRRSAWVIAALVLLLALCGWSISGADGAHRAINGGMPRSGEAIISQEAMWRWFGARPLQPVDMPSLFHLLADISRRAGLPRAPDLYYVAATSKMNGYAIGGPERSAIILTEGLLRSMTVGEIAGILAHEIAHIGNNDAWAMGWAAALLRAIELISLNGLAWLRVQGAGAAPARPLAILLRAAPALGQLLCLALSRIRELDADAAALELTGSSHGLIAALDKLELHHTGSAVRLAAMCEDGPTWLLRSHPATSERVGTLLNLAH